jgi:multidrug resistance efflux pump
MSRPIFRQVALERLSSPEQLDELMQVTTPRAWLALVALLGLIITVLAWSFSDTIPTQVLGRGILLRGDHVVRITVPASGLVRSVDVRPGDLIERDQVVAQLDTGDGELTVVRSPAAGQVIEVGVTPGGRVESGSSIVLLEDQARPLQAVVYMPAATGANVRPGMEVQISPVNLQREQYGFINGQVRSITHFPVTPQAMLAVLGNEQLVGEFLSGGAPMEVRIELRPNTATPSGYSWSSSRGPPFALNSGTICEAAITLSEKPPIAFVLPSGE